MSVFANISRRLRLPFSGGEINALSFWVSQFIMVLATILGVYLASSEGLKAAVKFNEITRIERNYYLRTSYANELEANADIVLSYAAQIKDSPPGYKFYDLNPLVLDQFVWTAMKESEATLETPSHFLQGGQSFYRYVKDTYKKLADKTFGHSHGAKLLIEAAIDIKEHLVPKIRQNTAVLQQQLKTQGVEVDVDDQIN
ncbi:hypothetical protein BTA51_23110 [Hahella sp. CCB-MM4]|uniref:hypothetical protein n=1 Tax=Hahella sp. (strain CCB-MM4) TaxID=1926491 RepID=UPI000B9C3005|nr:hypothetical protein [Hahella sp. CCB-MM4]OZG70998.1 hypothetical protein BTA51_23110 [Hahella sp. CCB-MM4]